MSPPCLDRTHFICVLAWTHSLSASRRISSTSSVVCPNPTCLEFAAHGDGYGPRSVRQVKSHRSSPHLIVGKPMARIRLMTNLRIQSIRSPFDHPRVASAAITALSRARCDGPALSTDHMLGRQCDVGAGDRNGSSWYRSGLPFRTPLAYRASDPARLTALLEKINEALDESPIPTREWPALQAILGLDLMARLLSISQSQRTALSFGDPYHTRCRGRSASLPRSSCWRSRGRIQRHRHPPLVRSPAQAAWGQHACPIAGQELAARRSRPAACT